MEQHKIEFVYDGEPHIFWVGSKKTSKQFQFEQQLDVKGIIKEQQLYLSISSEQNSQKLSLKRGEHQYFSEYKVTIRFPDCPNFIDFSKALDGEFTIPKAHLQKCDSCCLIQKQLQIMEDLTHCCIEQDSQKKRPPVFAKLQETKIPTKQVAKDTTAEGAPPLQEISWDALQSLPEQEGIKTQATAQQPQVDPKLPYRIVILKLTDSKMLDIEIIQVSLQNPQLVLAVKEISSGLEYFCQTHALKPSKLVYNEVTEHALTIHKNIFAIFPELAKQQGKEFHICIDLQGKASSDKSQKYNLAALPLSITPQSIGSRLLKWLK